MRNKREPEHITVTIDSLSHEGRGVSRQTGKTIFVQGALAGEEVHAVTTKKHSRYIEARVVEVLKPSNDRITPDCKHSEICGGCSLQHMSSSAQRVFKQAMMLEQFEHIAKLEPKTILPAIESTTTGYRRKARIGVRYVLKKEKLLIGFREKSSNYLADIDACTVLHPAVGLKFSVLRELIQSLSIFDFIPQIEIAVGDTDVALVLRHMRAFTDDDMEKLIAYAKTQQIHLYLQPDGIDSVHKIWPQDNVNRITYSLPDFNLTMHCHPMDFMQINLDINRKLVTKALELLDVQEHENVLDLFCGVGNFTLPLATRAKHVVAIEGAAEMVERINENAQANNITNIQAYCQNLHAEDIHFATLGHQFDKVLLDPPRTGALEVVKALSAHKPKRIVYISCHPATLARDAAVLCENGYTLTAAGVMDMFPHTTHIESMAVFDRKGK